LRIFVAIEWKKTTMTNRRFGPEWPFMT
jgi:hypothetical protein